MQRVAFFDIDGTLFRSSLLIELVERMIDEGVFPTEASLEYEEYYRSWLARESGYDLYIDAVVKTFLNHIRGVHYGTFADVGRQVIVTESRHVYRYTRDMLHRLKHEGYYLVAISQSPKTILDEFCSAYGFDKVYGRIYEIGPQDCFTGRVVDEHLITNKANIVRRVFEHNNQLDKNNSLAVGDTDGDIPLLESVDEPICFNPNELLYRYAVRRGWSVVVERKDVIYRL